MPSATLRTWHCPAMRGTRRKASFSTISLPRSCTVLAMGDGRYVLHQATGSPGSKESAGLDCTSGRSAEPTTAGSSVI